MGFNLLKDDKHYPEVFIKNSYDGSLQFQITGGIFRLVCSNGMVIGKVVSRYNYKHIGDDNELTDVPMMIDNVIESIEKEAYKINELQEIKFNDDQIPQIYNFFPQQNHKFLTHYFSSEEGKAADQTYYDILQLFTQITSHHSDRSSESTHGLESSVYDTVWSLAKEN